MTFYFAVLCVGDSWKNDFLCWEHMRAMGRDSPCADKPVKLPSVRTKIAMIFSSRFSSEYHKVPSPTLSFLCGELLREARERESPFTYIHLSLLNVAVQHGAVQGRDRCDVWVLPKTHTARPSVRAAYSKHVHMRACSVKPCLKITKRFETL